MSCSYANISKMRDNNYRINGEHGNPDIRKETKYCTLISGHEPISTPRGVNAGFVGNANGSGTSYAPWSYGIGLAYPIYASPRPPCTGMKTDNTRFNLPEVVYARNTKPVIINNVESNFEPQLNTPEGAKLLQGDASKFSR